MIRTLACALFAGVLASPATAQDADKTPPAIASVKDRMTRFVDGQEITGAVTLVIDNGKVVHLDATGLADVAAKTPMRPDTLFWIASMTKPVTGAAVMMLQDEGKLSVDDPVSKFIPEFAELKTPSGKPANLTIRHLLTHTSGLTDGSSEQSRGVKDLAGLMPIYLAKPTTFEPGSKWAYCQSGINTAARVVEVASGVPFADFLERRLFGPLGMKDTTFYPTGEQVGRLAKSYRKTKDALEPVPTPFLNLDHPSLRDHYPAANGGLFSTAPDYARFCRMLMNGGTFEGKRYLKPEAVKQMTSVQSGDVKTGFTPGNGWGIGCCVVREPQGVSAMLAPGTFGHGGAYGTQAWVDPVNQRIYVLMVQRANFPNSDDSPVRLGFQEAAAVALGSHSKADGR